MKRKRIKNADYSSFKRKAFLNLLLIFAGAVTAVLLLRMAARGRLGDAIVGFLENALHLDYAKALNIYQLTIRGNIEAIMLALMVVFFFLFFRIFLSSFTRYLNEIVSGIDALINGEDQAIELSPEMEFVEQKLNTLRQTLEKRAHEARQAEQKKNDLVMYLAHDIKTPLTSVIGYLSLLDEAPDMPPEQKAKYVHITLDKAYRLESLVHEFFEITRYNTHSITLARGPIDLYHMLVQMTDEFYPLLSPQNKRMAIHADEDLTIYGDAEKLARVFHNILRNAVAYSDAGSTIDLFADAGPDQAVLSFRNKGKRIPEKQLASIFEKFYRLDSARATQTGGAGLGLAIAKEIVLLHGGTITAESDETYTTFTVTLPQAPSDSAFPSVYTDS